MKWIRKLAVGVLAFVVVGLLILLVFVSAKPPSPPPLPNPNGYDDFVRAGNALVGAYDFSSLSDPDELRAAISTNAEALRLMRLGLTRDCVFPAQQISHELLLALPTTKNLVQLLNADGRLAEAEGRTNDAIADYVAAIEFGNEISRGGVLITRLVGIACEAIGYQPLARLTPQLSRDQLLQLCPQLESVETNQVPWGEVWRNEENLIRSEIRKRPKALLAVRDLWGVRSAGKMAEFKDQRIHVALRVLTTELALRAYQIDTGHAPAQLSELVPKYLRAVPQDAFRNQPLVYRTQGTNWILYSVGPDGVDNNGARKVTLTARTGDDLFYESPW